MNDKLTGLKATAGHLSGGVFVAGDYDYRYKLVRNTFYSFMVFLVLMKSVYCENRADNLVAKTDEVW